MFPNWWMTSSTLQIGFGHLPNAILQYLDNKKDLNVIPS